MKELHNRKQIVYCSPELISKLKTMKQLKIALLLCAFSIATLCTVTAKAQEKSDTAFNTNPSVYVGTEATALDTLRAVGETLTDTVLQKQVLAAVNTIQNTPKENTPEKWVAYGFAVVGGVYGAYSYFQAQKCRRLINEQDLKRMAYSEQRKEAGAQRKPKQPEVDERPAISQNRAKGA